MESEYAVAAAYTKEPTVPVEQAFTKDQTDFDWMADGDKAPSFAGGARHTGGKKSPEGLMSVNLLDTEVCLTIPRNPTESEDSTVLMAQIFSSFLLLLRRVREYTFIFLSSDEFVTAHAC